MTWNWKQKNISIAIISEYSDFNSIFKYTEIGLSKGTINNSKLKTLVLSPMYSKKKFILTHSCKLGVKNEIFEIIDQHVNATYHM
jgi:hypothetical protein